LLFHVRRLSVGGSPGASGGTPEPAPTKGWRGLSLGLSIPLAAVVAVGIWTPNPLSMALAQVAAILGGGRG
jgi:hypothetical protein